MKNYEYPGAIHIHTKYSDGTATINTIAEAAYKAGLKWIIITDHNSIEGLQNNQEGYYKDVCVLIGSEISPEFGNHYLAFDVKENISHLQDPKSYIKAVNEKYGFGFVAHPDEYVNRDNDYPPLRWDDWSVNGFQGLEIWNYMSDWVDTLTTKNKIYKVLNPNKTLHGPTKNVMEWWDNLNSNSDRVVPAIAGVDAHAFKFSFLGLPITIFPYVKTFKTLQNYIQIDDILSKDIDIAKKQIYNAIKNGHNIMTNAYLGKFKGSVFTATTITKENEFIKVTAGEVLHVENNFKISIEIPEFCHIKLIKDGKIISQADDKQLNITLQEAGSYRFETYKHGFHWILSNPIKVIKASDR